MIKSILKPFASLKLTVVLLALSIVLVFAGTWAQIDHDVWTVQKQYFHSFLTWVDLGIFLPRPAPGQRAINAGFPMPGGYTLIALLLINLVAAHSLRFKFTRGRIGVILIHAGLIFLILGEVVTSVAQRESRMLIHEGETVNFASDVREMELAIADTSGADDNLVIAIPASRLLQPRDTAAHPTLPFSVRVERFMRNSTILGPEQARQAGVESPVQATAGAGRQIQAVERPKVTGTGADAMRVDMPSAYVTLVDTNGQPIDTFLVSTWLEAPQRFDFAGKTWQIDLRPRRHYKPYSITLLDFKHDRYTGTNTPRNFSSLVRLVDPSRSENREVLIWMNNPLRYAGETFYQAGFDERADQFTILQVVRNPGWLIPYISCGVITLGMIAHFGAKLVGFLRRSAAPGASGAGSAGQRDYVLKPQRASILWPGIVTALCLVYMFSSGRPPKVDSPFDLNALGRIPISYEGRVLPLDTLARTSLRILSGKSEFRADGKNLPAILWLADVMGNPQQAVAHKVFRVDHPELKGLLGLDTDEKMFSINDLSPASKRFDEQWKLASPVPTKDQTLYQKSVIDLGRHIMLFNRLGGVETLFVAPPMQSGQDWKTFAQAAVEAQTGQAANPGLSAFSTLIQTYHEHKPDSFNATAIDYLGWMKANRLADYRRSSFEVMFNYFEPFIHTMTLYVIVFLLTCVSWMTTSARPTLQRTAYWVLLLALGFHTLGLIARVYIQGRPPVTNLYSSAVFIGWAAVVFCAVIEKIYRNGIGMVAASAVAFPTLIIAHYLAGSGDTMQMLQAVLDTNFWLATHVVVITVGYAATFLAGVIAAIYVIGGLFTRALSEAERRKALSRMVYGVVCFAMLFSFVGTILGGIWADQSWGRFWGWDPKENGAVLIVLWNAIILHARWGGIVRERGLMALAIFGNVITSWSWFGTNMLGVGLHSYGFMDSAVFWLGLFIATQLGLIAIANLPLRVWRSTVS